jgi:hypothetical protein
VKHSVATNTISRMSDSKSIRFEFNVNFPLYSKCESDDFAQSQFLDVDVMGRGTFPEAWCKGEIQLLVATCSSSVREFFKLDRKLKRLPIPQTFELQ